MKKNYIKPQAHIFNLRGPVVMLGGSNAVNDYDNGGKVNIGDSDEEP